MRFSFAAKAVALSLAVLVTASQAHAAAITYSGRIIKPDSTPETSASVAFTIQLQSPSGGCVIYSETQTLSMANSNGAFSLSINGGASARTDTTGNAFAQLFSNAGSLACEGGGAPYAPAAADMRTLVVTFDDGSGAGAQTLPSLAVNAVPSAESIGGFGIASLARVSSGTMAAFTSGQATELFSLLAGTSAQYAKNGANGALSPGGFAGAPSSPLAGQFWYDTAAHVLKYYDGTTTQTVGSASGSSITSGTIGGTTAINTSGSIVTTGSVSAGTVSATAVTATAMNAQQIAVWNAGNTFKTTISAPASLGTNFSFVLPSTAGTNGQALTTDGSGNLAWSTVSGGTGGSSQWVTSGTNISYVGGNVGIGTTAPGATFAVAKTFAETSGTIAGVNLATTISPGAASSAFYNPLYISVLQDDANPNGTTGETVPFSLIYYSGGAASTAAVRAFDIYVGNAGSGTIASGYGINATYASGGTAVTTAATALSGAVVNQSAGSIGTATGVFAGVNNTSSNTIGLAYGVYVGGVQATTRYSIYASDSSAPVYIAGQVGIGTTAPQAGLDVATTGTAASALIVPRDTDANKPSAPVPGMIRYNTTNAKFEAYEGSAWTNMIGGGGVANGTLSSVSSIVGSGTLAISGGVAGGTILFGSTSPVSVQSATPSTNPTSGALTVGGGVGVGGALNVAGAINGGSTASFGTSLTVPVVYGSSASGGTLILDSTSNATKGVVSLAPNGGVVGIGTTAPTAAALEVSQTTTGTSGTTMVSRVGGTMNPSGASTGSTRVFQVSASYNSSNSSTGGLVAMTTDAVAGGAGSVAFISGHNIYVAASGTSTMPNEIGINASAYQSGAGGVDNATGGIMSIVRDGASNGGVAGYMSNATGVFGGVSNSSTGTITNAYAGYFSNTSTAGTIANSYGVYISTVSGAAKWSIYADDATAPTYIAGAVGIGTTNPVRKLDVSGTDDDVMIRAVNTSSSTARFPGFEARNYGASGMPIMRFIRFRGSDGGPAAVSLGDLLGSIQGYGAFTTGYNYLPGAQIDFSAAENFSSTASGAHIVFQTTTTGTNALSEKMRLTADGKLGVGTNNPSTPLEVSASGDSTLTLRSTGVTQNAGLVFISRYLGADYASSFFSDPAGSLHLQPSSAGGQIILHRSDSSVGMVIDYAGRVGIGTFGGPTTALQVDGEISPAFDNANPLGDATHRFTAVYAVNGAIQTSDARLKRDVVDSDLGLDFIARLRPVSYRWNSGADAGLHYGLIAQEAEKAVEDARAIAGAERAREPAIVDYDKASDRYGLRYAELIAPLIKAVQELRALVGAGDARAASAERGIASVQASVASDRARLERLEAENARLERENRDLKRRQDEIKAYLCAQNPSASICSGAR